MRRQVESLLASDSTATNLLTELVRQQMAAGLPARFESTSNATCGPYRLIKSIGRGGMGEVWLAERTDGLVKRLVALKLPHSGLQAEEFAQRSHRERDILAGLAHRGIARLYDAGVDEQARPFLVLEFIEGIAIDRYCDERQLQIRARLSLFLQVLDAVQYAHSHLVIHSDLKPSNILVTSDGEVKLLDFGIAKLIKSEEMVGSDLTVPGSAALTPGYAAPEQLAGERVTTACDIYSLGVILFELLSGNRPYGLKRSPAGVLTPEVSATGSRPSQAATDPAHARARDSTPKKLSGALKGDLDNVTLKAIQQTPEKRYATVDAFKSDLERYLSGHPVLARPESAWYRAGKFVVRHKLPVAAAATVLIAIAIGFGIALWQSHVARREAQTAAAVQQFILDIFEANSRDQADPVKARQTTARALVDIGAKKIDRSLTDAPEAKEKMLSILSNLYGDFGLDDEAVALAKKRVTAAKQAFGQNDPRVAAALTSLGRTMHSSSSVNEREAVLLEAQKILDGNRDWSSPNRAALYSALAEHYQSSDRKKGLDFAARAVAIYRKLSPSDDFAGALYYEAVIYSYNDEDAKAQPLLAEALAVAQKLSGSLDPNIPVYASALAEADESLMRSRSAEENFQLAWNVAKKLNGEEHVDTIETEARLGRFLANVGRYREAVQHLGHATDVCLKIKGVDDPFFTPQMFFQYGEVLGLSGRLEEGLSYVARAIENRRKNRPGTRYLAQMLHGQALILADIGEDGAARQSLEEASVIGRKVGFNNGQDFVAVQIVLALNSNDRGSAKTLIERDVGPLPPNDVLSKNLLRNLYWRAQLALLNKDAVTAASLATRGLNLIASSGEAQYLRGWEARYLLEQGTALCLRGNPEQALPILKRAVQLETEMYYPSSPDLAVGQAALANCYLDLGDRKESVRLFAQAESIRALHKRMGEQYERPIRALRERLSSTHSRNVASLKTKSVHRQFARDLALRYRPVCDALQTATSSGVPVTTTSPPA
ncbi:MAG TPA: serine/threonine-protein kinase [Bryobacteraceae bacterium]|nr:serine/threonine-protein kinase [Bryobacteraceae bacterium]